MTFSFPTSASPSPSKKKNKNKKQTGPSFDGPFFVAPATPNRVGSSARLYFRSPESSLIKYCRGGSLRPPARLQQSRFRAMKEKSKIKLPARFGACPLRKLEKIKRNPRVLLHAGVFWRRHPDLNWGSGFCRPMPYHLAMSPNLCHWCKKGRLKRF